MTDFQVDPFELEKEWTKQSDTYHGYAEKAADARRDYDIAKAKLDVLKAEIYQRILQENEKKPTEKAIEALIISHPEHKKAVKAVIDAKHLLDVLNAAVAALDQKKHALQKLVDLFLADYYSKPKATSENAEEAIETMERRGRAVRMQRNREKSGNRE